MPVVAKFLELSVFLGPIWIILRTFGGRDSILREGRPRGEGRYALKTILTATQCNYLFVGTLETESRKGKNTLIILLIFVSMSSFLNFGCFVNIIMFSFPNFYITYRDGGSAVRRTDYGHWINHDSAATYNGANRTFGKLI